MEDDEEIGSGALQSYVWDKSFGGVDLAVTAFTPLALSCQWHTGWEDTAWRDTFDKSRNFDEATSSWTLPGTEEELVLLLHKRVASKEQDLRDCLLRNWSCDRRVARSAFTIGGETRTSPSYSHLLLMHKTLDLVLLRRRFERDGEHDRRRPVTPHLPLWKPRGQASVYYQSLLAWPSTLHDFLLSMKDNEGEEMDVGEEDSVEEEDEEGEEGGNSMRRRAASKVVKHLYQANRKEMLQRVESNFACAAAGLLACSLVSACAFELRIYVN